jgi:predicted Ser/Thr protein kinase
VSDTLPPPTPGDPDATGPHAAPEPAPLALADFRIVREIGRGGMGVVYEAEQVSLGRRVAVKVLRFLDALEPEARERFRREARTAAGLHHTHIVPVHAVSAEAGVDFYVMQLIDGRHLGEVLRRSGPLDPRTAARLGCDAAEALAYAHKRGVVHRDIKPSNLLLDADGALWLTDFGLARRSDDPSLTATGGLLGTPRYMSPEQAANAPIDHRTDVYSLGASLYELVTGKPVHDGATPQVVLAQIAQNEPVPPRRVRPALPRDLETILLKCLHRSPDSRYPDASVLADDFRAFLDGRPIRARRVGPLGCAARALRRQYRLVLSAAAAIALTLVLALFVPFLWRSSAPLRLGRLVLDPEAGGPAMTAEVLDDRDRPLFSFSLPQQEPAYLTPGPFQLRLSAPGRLSRTYRMDSERGVLRRWEARLGDQVIASERIGAGGSVAVAPARSGKPGFLVVQDGQRLRCLDAAGQPRWERGDIPVSYASQSPAPFWLGNESLLAAAPDLDGDGSPDVVLPSLSGSLTTAARLITALSGRTGALLWAYPPDRPVPQPRPPGPARRSSAPVGVVLGQPALLDIDGDGVRDLLVTVAAANTPGRRFLIALSGRTGQPLWQYDPGGDSIHDPGGSIAWAELIHLGGRRVLSWQHGSRILLLDPRTGRPAGKPIHLGARPVTPCRLADLDGDGSPEALVLSASGEDHLQLAAVSLLSGRVLWGRRLLQGSWRALLGGQWRDERGREYGFPPESPLIVRRGDGKLDVVTVQWQPVVANTQLSPRVFLEALAGASGESRWRRDLARYPRMPVQVPPRVAVGPKLDGGGESVFALSIVQETRWLREAPPATTDPRELYIDALGGADGRPIWTRSYPLADTGAVAPRLDALRFGPPGPDGWPLLLVPYAAGDLEPRTLTALEAGSGRVSSVVPGVSRMALADLAGAGQPAWCLRMAEKRNAFAQVVLLQADTTPLWRRMENCQPAGPLLQPGTTDLVRMRDTQVAPAGPDSCWVAAGSTGRRLWKTDGVAPMMESQFGTAHGELLLWSQADKTARLHAFNGSTRSGRLLYEAPLPTQGALRGSAWTPPRLFVPFADGGGRPGVLWIHHVPDEKGDSWRRRLSLLSSAGGERWSASMDDTPRQPGVRSMRLVGGWPPELLWLPGDLDGDGSPDLLHLEVRHKEGTFLCARDGATGRRLWSNLLDHGAPTVGWKAVVPGDGKSPARFFALRNNRRVVSFDGATGKPAGEWKSFRHAGVDYAPAAGPNAVVCRLGEGERVLVLPASTRSGYFLLAVDPDGRVRAVIPIGAARGFPVTSLFPRDAGEGRDELILVGVREVRAVSLRRDPDGAVTVGPRWRRPLQGAWPTSVRKRGDRLSWVEGPAVTWIDLASGRLLGRCEGPGRLLGALDEEGGTDLLAAYRDGLQGTTVRRAAPAADQPGSPVAAGPLADDPRFQRPLPWVPGLEDSRRITARVARWALVAGLALTAFAWLIRLCRPGRRTPSGPAWWCSCLLTAVSAGTPAWLLSLAPSSHLEKNLTEATSALVVVPVAFVPFAVLVQWWPARMRWWWRFALAALLASAVLLPALFLLPERAGLRPDESYSWRGWYLLLVYIAYLAGVLIIPLFAIEPAVMFYGLGERAFWPLYEKLGLARLFGVEPPPGAEPPA